jgi:predicted Zn-dependent protease
MNTTILQLPSVDFHQSLEASFAHIVECLRTQLTADEHFTLTLEAEYSQFTRFNQAKVRQTGSVCDGSVHLTLMRDQRSSYREFPLTGMVERDHQHLDRALTALRQEVSQLPIDPYLVLPTGHSHSHEIHRGTLLSPDQVAAAVLPAVADLDFTGIYAGGLVIRAYADSVGQFHWFATDTYGLDYSLFTPEGQAVKGTLAGSDWDPVAYTAKMQASRQQLHQLSRPARQIERGNYRTYLAPAAMAELMGMLSWGGVSESSYQQGGSCLAPLRRGEKQLSPQITLQENFEQGLVPRFNELGEVAPPKLPLIQSGELVNLLVSSATAQEYALTSNGASQEECLRSPELLPGTLANEEILAALDTGLYLGNLHYLNWSDRPTGRITGMTRYACFWVEGGEIVAPIANLRFDDTLYRFWGDQLVGLTDFQEFIPEVGTYGHRNLGGILTPGALLAEFTYTL